MDAIARLDAWLKANRADYYAELSPGAKDPEIAEIEKAAGKSLPDAFKAFLRWRNGQGEDCYDALQFNRSPMNVDDILATMDTMKELSNAGEFELEGWWDAGWVPFLDNGGGDHLVLDLTGSFGGKPGQVLEFWHADADRDIVAPSFSGWLESFVASLEADLWAEEDGDFHPEDDDELDEYLAERLPGYPIEVSLDGDGDD